MQWQIFERSLTPPTNPPPSQKNGNPINDKLKRFNMYNKYKQSFYLIQKER